MSNKKSIYEKIAELSASKNPRDNEWWGHDTSIGDLPKAIKELLEKEKLGTISKKELDKLRKEACKDASVLCGCYLRAIDDVEECCGGLKIDFPVEHKCSTQSLQKREYC